MLFLNNPPSKIWTPLHIWKLVGFACASRFFFFFGLKYCKPSGQTCQNTFWYLKYICIFFIMEKSWPNALRWCMISAYLFGKVWYGYLAVQSTKNKKYLNITCTSIHVKNSSVMIQFIVNIRKNPFKTILKLKDFDFLMKGFAKWILYSVTEMNTMHQFTYIPCRFEREMLGVFNWTFENLLNYEFLRNR